uniref:Transmembrane protein n=1 Tax=Rhizophora mucronata TaxID=61149 RepID=A0A2P2IRH5_RHIMU
MVGRYVAESAVKKLIAIASKSKRDVNHLDFILSIGSSWSGIICFKPTKKPDRTPWKPETGI